MVNSGSRKRTRRVSADVLDRLAAGEGAESRSRKRTTRKVSAGILDTLRDHTNTAPSAPQAPARTPGYGIMRRARVTAPEETNQEHARLRAPSPPDTGPTPGVDLRRAVDLDPPPLRDPDTNPEHHIFGEENYVDGDITSPVSPAAMDAAEFYVLRSPPPAQVLRRPAATPSADAVWDLVVARLPERPR